MRKIPTLTTLMLMPMIVLADGFVVEVTNQVATTNTQASASSAYKGYIEAIRIDVTGTTTGSINIASTDGEILYTNSAVTADITVRPRYITQSSTGVSLGAGTNDYARYLLNREGLVVTLAETAPVTNSYKVIVKLDRDSP